MGRRSTLGDEEALLSLRKSSLNKVGRFVDDSYQFVQSIFNSSVFNSGDFAVFNAWMGLSILSNTLQQQKTKPSQLSKKEAYQLIIKKQSDRAEAVRAQAAREKAAKEQADKEHTIERAVVEKAARRHVAAKKADKRQAPVEQAAREQAVRERAVRKKAAGEQKEQAWKTLRQKEAESLFARHAIWSAEQSIERAWGKMERWKVIELDTETAAQEVATAAAVIETAAQEIQSATKEIQAKIEEIKAAEEQQQIAAEQIRKAEETLEIIKPTPSPPCHPHYDDEKIDAVVESLRTVSETILFRYPVLPVAAILVAVYAGKTLAGALIGGVLLGMSFAPPLLALAIVGLVYLKQKIDKPSKAPRHSFFYVNSDEHEAGIANTPSSFINEEDHSDGLINIYQ